MVRSILRLTYSLKESVIQLNLDGRLEL
ncbi:hypothetical protein AYI70_g6837, partial [Smittium culicis]